MFQNISKKTLIVVAVSIVVIAGLSFYLYKNSGPKGLTEQEKKAFLDYVKKNQSENPTPSLTSKEQSDFLKYVSENNAKANTDTQPKSNTTTTTANNTTINTTPAPSPAAAPVQTLTKEQQDFIKYIQSQQTK